MLDELEIIKEMVAGLSTAGIWGFAIYLTLGFLKSMAFYVLCFLISKGVFDLVKTAVGAPVTFEKWHSTKTELERFRRENAELRSDVHTTKIAYLRMKESFDAERAKWEAECDDGN